MGGFTARQLNWTFEAGGVAIKHTGPCGVFSLWVLGPVDKEHGKCPSGFRHVFLCSDLNSKMRAGWERPCFLRVQLLLPWKRPFWPTGPNNIPQSFQEL